MASLYIDARSTEQQVSCSHSYSKAACIFRMHAICRPSFTASKANISPVVIFRNDVSDYKFNKTKKKLHGCDSKDCQELQTSIGCLKKSEIRLCKWEINYHCLSGSPSLGHSPVRFFRRCGARRGDRITWSPTVPLQNQFSSNVSSHWGCICIKGQLVQVHYRVPGSV